MLERQQDKREESKVVFDLCFHLKVNQISVERQEIIQKSGLRGG